MTVSKLGDLWNVGDKSTFHKRKDFHHQNNEQTLHDYRQWSILCQGYGRGILGQCTFVGVYIYRHANERNLIP